MPHLLSRGVAPFLPPSCPGSWNSSGNLDKNYECPETLSIGAAPEIQYALNINGS